MIVAAALTMPMMEDACCITMTMVRMKLAMRAMLFLNESQHFYIFIYVHIRG